MWLLTYNGISIESPFTEPTLNQVTSVSCQKKIETMNKFKAIKYIRKANQ